MSDGSKPANTEIKISVRELKIGMFVCRLDCDWLETPFLLQGVEIRSDDDINELAKYCQHVYIIGEWNFAFKETIDIDSNILIGRTPQRYSITTNIAEELQQSKIISVTARKNVKDILERVSRAEEFDSEVVKNVVRENVDSIIRHPDAQLLMTRLRGQDEYTIEHCLNVCILAIVFGRRLGLRKHQLFNLGMCGLLHDVGKMRVPSEILNKPGRLNSEEFEEMKRHTTYGKEYLSKAPGVLEEAITVAYTHHERPDGLGYPQGLPDGDISMFSKIISVVDAYDAITGDRVYAPGRPSSEALRIIYEGRGKQFDEKFALAFIQTIGLYPPGTLVELVNGGVGLVIESEEGRRHLPNLLLLLDKNKKPCGKQVVCLIDIRSGNLDKGYYIKKALTDGSYDLSLSDYYQQGLFDGVAIRDQAS